MNEQKISVLIATWRRADFLPQCLDSLLAQKRKPNEIVLVTRKDDFLTNEIVEKYRKKHSIVKHFFVAPPGVVPAENRGWRECTGDIVCFIDDDAIAFSDWLERIEKHFLDESVGAVGGPSISVVNGKPVIMKAKNVFRIYWFGWITSNSQHLTDGIRLVDHLRGCNMAFRRKTLKSFGENLYGNFRWETDACLRIKNQGYKIIFDPEIKVHHFLGVANRCTPFNYGVNTTYLLLKHSSLPRKIVFLLFTFLVGDFDHPGLLMFPVLLILKRNQAIVKYFIRMNAGKIHGMIKYLKVRKK